MQVSREFAEASKRAMNKNRAVNLDSSVKARDATFYSIYKPVDYRPSVDVSVNFEKYHIWVKLDNHTKDWLAAILSATFNTDRFLKLATNAIVGHTNCSLSDAKELATHVRHLTLSFSNEERVAIKIYWHDALRLNRHISTLKSDPLARARAREARIT